MAVLPNESIQEFGAWPDRAHRDAALAVGQAGVEVDGQSVATRRDDRAVALLVRHGETCHILAVSESLLGCNQCPKRLAQLKPSLNSCGALAREPAHSGGL